MLPQSGAGWFFLVIEFFLSPPSREILFLRLLFLERDERAAILVCIFSYFGMS